MTKEMYTAVGIAGIMHYHTAAFDKLEHLMAHLDKKPRGINWHIMKTVKMHYEGPSSPWPRNRLMPRFGL